MKDAKKPMSSSRAIESLGWIGEPAIPVLRGGLADSNQFSPSEILSGFRTMAFAHGTNACWPILIEALNHNDPTVRARATNILEEYEFRELPIIEPLPYFF
jgi:hypothetical protein